MNLPRDAVPFHASGCLSGIRLVAELAQGTEERCHWNPPCQPGPSEGPSGDLACFPEGAALALWGLELVWPPLASVFPKVPLAQAPLQQLGPNQRGGQYERGHQWARIPSGAALGRSCPAGEVSARSGRPFRLVPSTTTRGPCS